MGRPNKHTIILKKAHNAINCRPITMMNKIPEITDITSTLSNDQEIKKITTHKKRLEKKRSDLMDNIKSLLDDDIVAACHLFKTMTYPKGCCVGRVLSPYVVNKAKEFVIAGLNKQTSSVSEMQDKIKQLEKENKRSQKNKENLESCTRSLRTKVAQGEKAKVRHIGMI
ncbi:18539_t:CDS:1 [Entrophospora sp. SA101]|nr:8695_t:CDS:1 [Entrophospora sp. SA101]CAJ0745279.1 18539_t:CDS:1 [Entrophospora sp. SA101]